MPKPTDYEQTFISVFSLSSQSHLSKKSLVLINLPEAWILRGVHISGSGCMPLTVALGLLLPATGFQVSVCSRRDLRWEGRAWRAAGKQRYRTAPGCTLGTVQTARRTASLLTDVTSRHQGAAVLFHFIC